MSQIKLLKIFLASPSDVSRERKYVLEVVEELDKSIAITNGLTIQVVSSDSAFPGYGQDGQTVLNKQIGRMKEYDLFLGIMWSRIGTPTPRSISGTAEEYDRAVRAYNRYEKPQIWFYFRELKAKLDTKEKLEQADGVIKFKKKVQRKALVREYKMPSNFRDRFRQDMLCWLSEYLGATPKPSVTSSNRSNKSSTAISNSNSSTTKTPSRRKSGSTSTANKKTSSSSSSKTRQIRSVTTSGAWMMLGDNFFSTQSVKHQTDGNIIIRIAPKNSTDEANLRALQPSQYNWSSQGIPYAYQNEAGNSLIQTVLPESIKGKTIFVLTLKPEQRSQVMGMEVNINGYSADKIAELRARLLLLNENPPHQKEDFLNHLILNYDSNKRIEKSIFPDLWTKMKRRPTDFLRQARLAAVYHLKMTNTVEQILELKLGFINNKTMSVLFRGQRKNFNLYREPYVIEVKGSCKL
ncbi:MAG: DUF4062 domain-containing protein [Cyanobacteria bacterium P01_F01_bin.143]